MTPIEIALFSAEAEVQAAQAGLRSKWGFHPCTYEVFCKLRKLHKMFWEQQRKIKAYKRWKTKDPKNRTGEAPKYIEFMKTRLQYAPNRRPYPDTDGHPIRMWYQQARCAQERPVVQFNSATLQQINEWLQMTEDWK